MLRDPVRDIVAAEAMPPAAAAARVVLAELGDHVGVVGAGVVAREYARLRKETIQQVSNV
jgi:glucokinase